MSGELIVNDPQGAKPRAGGYEFTFDAAKGLWAVPDMGGLFGVFDLAFSRGRMLKYTVSRWSGAAKATPATASPLWDKPETVVGEIIAYRGWEYDFRVTSDGAVDVRLESRHNEFFWDGPVTAADVAPTASNPNGLYAVSGSEHHEGNFAEYVGDAPIWGRVALSGIVVEGDLGYRAERATIQELWVNAAELNEGDSAEGMCKLLGDRYQCDVSVREPSWASLAEK